MTLRDEQAAHRAIFHNIGQALSEPDVPEKTRRWLREIGKIARAHSGLEPPDEGTESTSED